MKLLAWAGLQRRLGWAFATRPAAGNFLWLAADRGLRIGVALVVGSWSARYLGKANFGLLSYVMACVAVFAAIAPLGMEALVVREVIRDQPAAGRWLGTVIGFRGAAAFICALLAIAAVAVLRRGELLPLALVALLGAGLVGQSLESGELFFQARNEMRRLIVPRLGLFLAMNALKVGLILGGLSVFWFSVLTALEQVLGGLLTLVLLRHALGESSPLRFEAARGWGLLKEAWPVAPDGFGR